MASKRRKRTTQFPKSVAQKLHFAKRFEQRTGVKYSRDIRDHWAGLIVHGHKRSAPNPEVLILDKVPGNKSLFTTIFMGVRWVLVWDTVRSNLVSIYEYNPAIYPQWDNYEERKRRREEDEKRPRDLQGRVDKGTDLQNGADSVPA